MVVVEVCVAVMEAQWLWWRGCVCGCDGGAVVVVEGVCVAAMVARWLWWRVCVAVMVARWLWWRGVYGGGWL